MMKRSFFAFSRSARRGFTLVELLVVIAIIAILASIMLTTVGSGNEAARAARCLTNLKNLATACHAAGGELFPAAGCFEYSATTLSGATPKTQFFEEKGWISWNSQGLYPADDKRSPSIIKMCSATAKERDHALTNGCLWAYVGSNREIYRCPSHLKLKGSSKNSPIWSYLMNERFGWQKNGKTKKGRKKRESFKNADRVLLFGEVPFTGLPANEKFPTGLTNDESSDAILQYDTEYIGFNHKSSHGPCAHVVFADGHCEKIQAAKTMKKAELIEVTKWLCEGSDISFDGQKFTEIEK